MVMKIEALDLARWDKGLDIMEGRIRNILGDAPAESNEIFYNNYHQFFRKIKKAGEDGTLVAANTSIPAEIIWAMGLQPAVVINSTFTMAAALDEYRKPLDVADEYGIRMESCSGHRGIMAYFAKGWFPRPAVYITMGTPLCDAFAYSGRVGEQVYGGPRFVVDRPHMASEENIQYLRGEFKDMITFLEENTSKKMDWDRLREMVARSAKMVELQKEIAELRKAVPSPIPNIRPIQINWFQWIYAGQEPGLNFLQAVRDEVKELVDQGKGFIEHEKYRFIDGFHPPLPFLNELYVWLQQEKGASAVMEMFLQYWGEGELEYDPDDPLLYLAKKVYEQPFCNVLYPFERYNNHYVKAAKDYKADGHIRWNMFSCRQAPQTKIVEDMLEKEIGIPTLSVELDLLDPTFRSLDEIKDDLEMFFEMIDERKA